jgi:SAM-dependent methyltransferase
MLFYGQTLQKAYKLLDLLGLDEFTSDYFKIFNQEKLIYFDNEIDKALGFDFDKTERNLQESAHNYRDSYIDDKIKSLALQTSYLDFIQIFTFLDLKPNEHFIDIGAGYGRSSFLINMLFNKTRSTAIEHVRSRVQASKDAAIKYHIPLRSFQCEDILKSDYTLPIGEYYFLYLPIGNLLFKVLNDLKSKAHTKSFKIIAIESHGELINRLEKEKWLSQGPCELESISPRHDNKVYIYEVNRNGLSTADSLLQKIERLHFLKESNFQILIRDKDINSNDSYIWSASSKELEFNLLNDKEIKLDLKYPQRSIKIKDIVDIDNSTYPPFYFERENNLNIRIKTIQNSNLRIAGYVRKIITSPLLIIEFSSIGRVSHSDITYWETY